MRLDEGQEGISRYRIECIFYVKGDINIGGVWGVSQGELILRGGQCQCRYGNRHLSGLAKVTRQSECVVRRRTIEPWEVGRELQTSR